MRLAIDSDVGILWSRLDGAHIPVLRVSHTLSWFDVGDFVSFSIWMGVLPLGEAFGH